MAEHGLPALHALFAWWISTGLIVYLDNLPRKTFRWSMVGATVVLGLSFWAVRESAAHATVWGAYVAFTAGLLVWGWQEISFYMGFVTGPRRHACEPGCGGWAHFRHALMASLHHEIAIVLSGAVIAALTWDSPNRVALWTYATLAIMHESARLNVFLGTPNVTEEFLPPHLAYLKSFIAKRDMNPLFPASVTLGTCSAIVLGASAFAADATPFEEAGYSLLGMLMIIALAEHWFLILPLNFGALWAWSLKKSGRAKNAPAQPVETRDVVTGLPAENGMCA